MHVPNVDQGWRHEVMNYLVSRYERASVVLREGQWEAFRDFVQIWLDTFDWRTPEGIARYLALNESQRTDRFTRFQRQAASWDVTLDFPIEPRVEDKAGDERERRRKQYEKERRRFEERAAQRKSRWDAIREMLEAEHALRQLPDYLRDSYRFLGLPPRATLADARKRYRDLAKKYHPDVSGDQVQMQRLNEAWQKIVTFFLS